MKQFAFFFLLGLLALSFQINTVPTENRSDFKQFLQERYESGEFGFINDFYSIIIYPEISRFHGKTGLLKVRLVLDEKGNIAAITFLNKVDFDLEEEVRRVLMETAPKWKGNGIISNFEFNIAFKFQQNAHEIEGDLNVIGKTDFQVKSRELLEKELNQALEEL